MLVLPERAIAACQWQPIPRHPAGCSAGEEEGQASGRKRKKKGGGVGGGMRKTRGMLAEKSKGGPKSFKDWLDEV